MVRRLALSLVALTGCSAGGGSGPAVADATGDALTDALDSEGDDSGSGDDGSDSDGEPGDGDEFGRAQLRRLTHAQFVRSVQDLLGEGVVVNGELEPDLTAELFTTVGASVIATSSVGIERYEAAALDAAHQVFVDPARRDALVGCDVEQDAGCAEDFLARLGRRAWRRPLGDDELARYVELADAPGIDGDRWLGLELAVAGLLQSPNFLYLVELGEPDPDAPERTRYTDWEMAGRLAAFVWASAPDDVLLDAAAAGELVDADGVETQIVRMLADPRAEAALGRFFEELLHVDVVDGIAKDPTVFPEADTALFQAMRGEAQRMITSLVVEQDADVRDLFDTRETFVTAELAALYGMDAPDPALMDAQGFAPVTIPDDWARTGFFGTGLFLAGSGTVTRTSPTKRGNFVQRRIRCAEVPPPPDDVEAEFPTESEQDIVTMRERLAEHRENPTCANCHDLMDPLGLALEHFDGIGRHRETDRGLTLDVSGELDGVGFDGLTGLAGALRADPSIAPCLAGHAYRFAIGHADSTAEADIVAALGSGFEGDGFRFAPLVRAIVASEGFRFRGRAQQ